MADNIILYFDVNDRQPSAKSIHWSELRKINYVSNCLSLMTVNARSISNKFSEFLGYVSMLKFKLSFILITESWLSESSDFLLEIPGYNSFNYYRKCGRGGGLKFYVLKSINCKIIETPLNTHVKF